LLPVLAQTDNLPLPQRNAIQAAFAMTDAAVPDLFLIALVALELLSEVAGYAPVVLIADDAQWLDRSSADVLAFVARRCSGIRSSCWRRYGTGMTARWSRQDCPS
jgi:hypothetical protein